MLAWIWVFSCHYIQARIGMRWHTLLTSCQEVQCLLSCCWPSKLNYLVKALEFLGVRCIFSFVPLKLWASCFLITTHSMVQHPRIVLAWISYILRSWNAGLLPFKYFADIILQVNQTVNYQLSCLDRVREFIYCVYSLDGSVNWAKEECSLVCFCDDTLKCSPVAPYVIFLGKRL